MSGIQAELLSRQGWDTAGSIPNIVQAEAGIKHRQEDAWNTSRNFIPKRV
jgi:hypothetical protein